MGKFKALGQYSVLFTLRSIETHFLPFVLMPEGYHPVTSAPDYSTYYVNLLVESARSLANQDDPRYSCVKQTYRQLNPRLPLY